MQMSVSAHSASSVVIKVCLVLRLKTLHTAVRRRGSDFPLHLQPCRPPRGHDTMERTNSTLLFPPVFAFFTFWHLHSRRQLTVWVRSAYRAQTLFELRSVALMRLPHPSPAQKGGSFVLPPTPQYAGTTVLLLLTAAENAVQGAKEMATWQKPTGSPVPSNGITLIDFGRELSKRTSNNRRCALECERGCERCGGSLD